MTESTQNASKKRVLVVEDDPNIRKIMSSNLRHGGYQTFVAQDGIKALDLTDKIEPHCIVLDILMPRMGGVETLEKLRESNYNGGIVMATAISEVSTAVECLTGGADDYITKPYSPKALIKRVGNIIRKNELEKNLQYLQRQAMVGKGAASMAHDYNNLLYGIQGYVEVAALRAEDPVAVRKNLKVVMETCARIDELNKNILRLYKGNDLEKKSTNLEEYIKTALSFVRGDLLTNKIKIVEEYEPTPDVQASSDLIFGFYNLIINAKEAMLDVEGEKILKLQLKDKKEYARIRVIDSGRGLDDSTTKMFHELVTEKENHYGLGLNIVRETIRDHNGTIECISSIGEGTQFCIKLPYS